MQDLQSPTTFQAELSGFTLGQEAHPISNSLQLPSQTRAAENLEWGIDVNGFAPYIPQASLMLGVGTCSSGGHNRLPAAMEIKAVREGRSGVLPTLPSLGLWPGKWGKGRGERSSSSWNRREPLSCPAALNRLQEAAAQIHNVLPNPRPLIQLSAGQTSQIFLCVSACENLDVCESREL